jgi:hypothetical protein
MKKNKKIIQAAAILFLLLSNLFSFNPQAAYAFSCSITSGCNVDVNEVIREINPDSFSSLIPSLTTQSSQSIEKRYGINQNIWRTAEQKVTAPRADIFFDNANPKPGEKVTAHATPEYFKNDPQNLYYTWYLIHTKDGNLQTATNSINKGKAEAAAIMARGDYDPNLDGQIYNDSDQDPDKDGWPTVDKNSYSKDACAAPYGGSDGVGGLGSGNDNIEPYDNSGEYCSSKASSHSMSQCDLLTDKPSFNQYYNLKSSQNNYYCSKCAASGAVTYSSLSSNNQCCYSIAYPITDPDDPNYVSYDPNTSYCPTSYNYTYESCFDYSSLATSNQSAIATCLNGQYASCQNDWDTSHDVNNGNTSDAVSGVTRCYGHNFGTNAGASGYRGYSGDTNSTSGSDASGTDDTISCKHKWVNAPDYTSGSGKLTTGEEKYWKTDPTSPDTDGDGISDGAAIVGLGHDTFTWTYQTGDRVGVVVEGTSMIPTDEQSAYYKIMWGYLDVCDSTKVGLIDNDECDGSGDYGYGFLATRFPGEGGDEKLRVSLSYSPDNPVADPSDANKANIKTDETISDADQITVSSSLDSTDNNPNNLYYTWQISKGDNAATEDWKEIKDIKGNFNTASASSGLGLTDFSFTPKTSALSGDGNVSYFKVTLTVATAADINQSRGRSSVVIAVNKNGIKVKLYKVDIRDGKAVLGKEVCNDGLYKTLCPAVQYQMLAAKVDSGRYKSDNSEFSWSLDGNPVSPPENSSQLFDGWSNTSVFFPITKEEQAIHQISVTATPKDALQPVTGSRSITIVKPALFIKSSDSSASWPTTYTVADPNKKFSFKDVESDTNYQALTNKELPYYVSFVPDYLITDDPLSTLVDWKINGASMSTENVSESAPGLTNITMENNNQTIRFTTDDQENQSYILGAKITKYWGEDERNILSSAWNIGPETLDGESSIIIDTTAQVPAADEGVQGAMGTPTQILAAIGTHLPHYFMYLLRLALTLLVMFLLSAGLYGVSQNISLYDEEK